MTREQYRCLTQWAQGHFAADWSPAIVARPQHIEDVPLADRPHALDEAALAACLGGPFHPGCEATWPLRHASMYADLCRLVARKDSDPPEPDYGEVLAATRALGVDGPLHRSGPGDITRWMAVPWQTDTASCGSQVPNSTQASLPLPGLPDLPTFWPARVPNAVLTEQAYRKVMDGMLAPAARHTAFDARVQWSRHLPPFQQYPARISQAITSWSRVGIVTRKDGPGHDSSFPSAMHVEMENSFPEAGASVSAPLATAPTPPANSTVRDHR